MSICTECLVLQKKLADLQLKYDELLIEHDKLVTTSTRFLERYTTVERQEQIGLTDSALKSFDNQPITLAPLKGVLKDDNDG